MECPGTLRKAADVADVHVAAFISERHPVGGLDHAGDERGDSALRLHGDPSESPLPDFDGYAADHAHGDLPSPRRHVSPDALEYSHPVSPAASIGPADELDDRSVIWTQADTSFSQDSAMDVNSVSDSEVSSPLSPCSLAWHDDDSVPLESDDARSSNDNHSDDEDLPELDGDPAYVSREDLFDDRFEGTQQSADADCESELPPAFNEHRLIRNAYINAFILATFHHATHEAIQSLLESQRDAFLSITRETGYQFHGLDKMACTLRTGDEPGKLPPSNLREKDAFPDPVVRMNDIYDGWGWRAAQAGLERRRGGKWTVQDVDVHELDQRFVSLPCGLMFAFNIDWFSSVKKGHHSSGAVYLTILNNPRGKRYLREETVLVSMPPGPFEPSLEQLNHIFEPLVDDLQALAAGEYFRVHGLKDQMLVHGQLYMGVSDLPASRKAAGLRGPTSKDYTCPYCYQTFDSLTTAQCFDRHCLRMRDDWRFLKYAYKARDADEELREEIAERRGVRWSVLDLLPGWMPARSSPPEFMHASFLVQIRHTFQEILVGSGLFTSRGRNDKPLLKLEKILNEIWWPASSGRVPRKVSSCSYYAIPDVLDFLN
ncbi:hypothetical protein EVJ58_g10857 [Rhodofomes roseus]|uniref:Uncharacterized protein n=1 Tax=Rhodofomes roseus TaxID=34475 RepID=A0A4Y9XM93_9APHY|nr:hypothetical protein EVJ58_g10857 [Rhodofomes roseus]